MYLELTSLLNVILYKYLYFEGWNINDIKLVQIHLTAKVAKIRAMHC